MHIICSKKFNFFMCLIICAIWLYRPYVCSLTLSQAGFFEFLKGRGAFWSTSEKLIKAVYLNHLKLCTTHLWTCKNFNISYVIKMIMSALFLMMPSFNYNFFCLSNVSFAQSQLFLLKSNDLNLY